MNKRYFTAFIKLVDTELVSATLTIKANDKSHAEVIAKHFCIEKIKSLPASIKIVSGKKCTGCGYAKEEK